MRDVQDKLRHVSGRPTFQQWLGEVENQAQAILAAAMDNRDRPLNGLRLLLVEDDPVIAMELDELIQSLGAEVVGPFNRLAPAPAAVSREVIAGAVLDFRLDGEPTIPIIDVLLDCSKPILLVTGGGPGCRSDIWAPPG